MLVKSMLTTALLYNDFVNKPNKRKIMYNEYELVQIASVLLDIPIKDVAYKNKLYYMYSKSTDESVKAKLFNKLNGLLSADKILINQAIQSILEESEQQRFTASKIPGVVAILIHDYK